MLILAKTSASHNNGDGKGRNASRVECVQGRGWRDIHSKPLSAADVTVYWA